MSGSDVPGEQVVRPTPTRWDASVHVAAPRQLVFDYLADPRNRPEWQASLRRVELLGPLDDVPYVGLRWRDVVKVGPPFELEISALVPGELWAEVGSTGPFTARGTLLFGDEAGGTRVRCIARVGARGPARPLGPAATLLAAVLVRNDLARAARVIGRRVGTTGT